MGLKIFTFIFLISLLSDVGAASALSNPNGGNWNYYREIMITENSGHVLNNYQVLLKFDPTNFPDNAKPDGSDIRFIKSGVELDIWIEKYDPNKKNAMIWVKFPEIPANEDINIKMYYGNEKASSVSDVNATLEFFDDFNDEMYSDKWDDNEENWIESDGTIKPSDEASKLYFYSAIFLKDIALTDDIIVESTRKPPSGAN